MLKTISCNESNVLHAQINRLVSMHNSYVEIINHIDQNPVLSRYVKEAQKEMDLAGCYSMTTIVCEALDAMVKDLERYECT